MPYKIIKGEGSRPWKIVKGGGEVVGTSESKEDAESSMKARYAGEKFTNDDVLSFSEQYKCSYADAYRIFEHNSISTLSENDVKNCKIGVDEFGGEGSGNFGHAGRPGEIGGSGEGGGKSKVPVKRATVDDIGSHLNDIANTSNEKLFASAKARREAAESKFGKETADLYNDKQLKDAMMQYEPG
uniref:Uncharacterized protein n=1 Tax=viral metagenome TaxID=1070528 RepID=A0A6M3IRB9_9ZZZZ